MRRPGAGNVSYERLYRRLSGAFPIGIDASIVISRFMSRGFLRRLYITIEASFRRADVLHVTGDANFLTLLLPRSRTVLTVHDAISVSRLKGLKRRLFILLWYRLPMSRARVITVVSSATKDRLQELGLVNGCDVRVIHNPAFPEFTHSPKAFNSSCPTILVVGTSEHKNVPRLVEAMAGLPCKLRVIGKIDRATRDRLNHHNIVYSAIHGISDTELVDEYRNCDLLAFVSLEEGFGLPILEAQATGRPVVTSSCSSMPEVAGGAAALVDPTDSHSIRTGLLRVINDDAYRALLVQRGLENARRFTLEGVARQYAILYREIAGSLEAGSTD